MRIGALARRVGVTASRIRFYEARGLLPPPDRHTSGYRDYDDEALAVLSFIMRARTLGFSLAEISAHLTSPRDSRRKARLLMLVEAKVVELDGKMAAMARQRGALAELVAELHNIVERATT